MSIVDFIPPICGCSDRSSRVRALYKCESCGHICKFCYKSCRRDGHKVRKLRTDEIGTSNDWIKAYGYPL